VLAFVVGGLLALAPAVALATAGSGDYCEDCQVAAYPAISMDSSYHAAITDTESWNTPGNGYGSCTGVYQTSLPGWAARNCVADGTGYDAVYCGDTSCYSGTLFGHAAMQDADSVAHDFTGWVQWSS
jgi:hypothetical protein